MNKRIDILVVILVPVIAAIVTVVFKTNYFVSISMFFASPSVYIVCRNRGIVKKSALTALIFGTIFLLLIDPLAIVNGSWLITQTIFSVKLLGIIPVEDIMYALLWVFLATLFYEHFFDKGRSGDAISGRIRYAAYPFAVIIAWILILFYLKQAWLRIPYYYLAAGMIFTIIPLLLFLAKFQMFWKRFFVTGLYFAYLLLTFELVALHNGQWAFPGKGFIGFMTLFGYSFPIEEFVIWIIFATPSLMAYYEFFADDRKLAPKQ